MNEEEVSGNVGAPVRVLLVGAGNMGRNWLRLIGRSQDALLVGLVDLDLDLARRVAREEGIGSVVVGSSLPEVARTSGAEAVVNVTVPVAHHPVNTEALFLGLPVLCEKPIAPSVGQTLSLVAASEVTGRLLMTSQSRRYYKNLALLKRRLPEVGRVGVVATEFFKGPRMVGFRDRIQQPLLVDMAIHAFDAARYLLGADPVSVRCESFNPSWSWYAGDAASSAQFVMSDGSRYLYTGSWCSAGLETSWNGAWRVSGSEGTATWDGEGQPQVERVAGGPPAASSLDGAVADPEGEEIAGAFAEFLGAVRSGRPPSGEVHSNIMSLAMVEAAVLSAESERRIFIGDMLESAYEAAIGAETREEVKARMQSWGSARAGLTGTENAVPL